MDNQSVDLRRDRQRWLGNVGVEVASGELALDAVVDGQRAFVAHFLRLVEDVVLVGA